jgi:hypothetical protein
MIVSAQELIDRLVDAGIPLEAIRIKDGKYRLPTRAFIEGEFAQSFEAYKKSKGLNDYIPEVNDCDDFATRAVGHIQELHTASEHQGCGIAFGRFSFFRDNGGAHELNVTVTDDGVNFFEPQTSKIVEVNENERFLCTDSSI